jgi:hypothetical protein
MTTINPSEFIKTHSVGILSTHSISMPGFPFGSVTPYVINDHGHVAILISHLAEHTQNILENPKVALTIFEPDGTEHPQAGARISCMATAVKAENQLDLRERYRARFPNSEMILDLPGFEFYQLNFIRIRLIAGFGQIKWLEPEQLDLAH